MKCKYYEVEASPDFYEIESERYRAETYNSKEEYSKFV